MRNLRILPLTARQSIDGVKTLSDGPIITCDFYIENVERIGTPVTGGYQFGNVINIDHHAPVPAMRRHVSSANLAIEFVQRNGLADSATTVALNHGDCDSVLSGAIILGRIEPCSAVGEAAIAADHTGEVNDIADMLQGLDEPGANHLNEKARIERFDFAVRNVNHLLAGEPLEKDAHRALMDYRRRRMLASELVGGGAFTQKDGFAFGIAPSRIDGAFLPALLPEAVVILYATRSDMDSGSWKMKARVGNAAPAGFNLFDLNLPEFDVGWGGRWNAGSNSRAGGSTVEPRVYADEVRTRLVKALKAQGHRDKPDMY